MAIQIMSAVYSVDLPSSEKFVLLILADHSDLQGRCWPSQARIAKYTGLSVNTVIRCINALVDKNYIKKLSTGKSSANTTNYQLNLNTIAMVGGANPNSPHGDTNSPHGGGKLPPSRYINRKEPSGTRGLLSAEEKQHQKDLAQKALDEHMARLASRRNN